VSKLAKDAAFAQFGKTKNSNSQRMKRQKYLWKTKEMHI